MSVLILEPNDYSPRALKLYEAWGAVWLGEVPANRWGEVKVLVVRLGYVLSAAFLSAYPNLRAIITPTTAVTHIDMGCCAQRGIRVISLAACSETIEYVTSTSELTLGLILALLRGIPKSHNDVVTQGLWDRDRYRSRQLSCLSLGVVGLGRLGGHMVRYARALDMKVLACDPHQPDTRFAALGLQRNSLDEILPRTDILSIHANLRDDNRNLIGAREIALLPPEALIVNTARGVLLDEMAAVRALREGHLGGIAVDVLAGEHSGESCMASPLVQAARDGLNVIVTPHIGGCTVDAMHLTEDSIAEAALKICGDLS